MSLEKTGVGFLDTVPKLLSMEDFIKIKNFCGTNSTIKKALQKKKKKSITFD